MASFVRHQTPKGAPDGTSNRVYMTVSIGQRYDELGGLGLYIKRGWVFGCNRNGVVSEKQGVGGMVLGLYRTIGLGYMLISHSVRVIELGLYG